MLQEKIVIIILSIIIIMIIIKVITCYINYYKSLKKIVLEIKNNENI